MNDKEKVVHDIAFAYLLRTSKLDENATPEQFFDEYKEACKRIMEPKKQKHPADWSGYTS